MVFHLLIQSNLTESWYDPTKEGLTRGNTANGRSFQRWSQLLISISILPLPPPTRAGLRRHAYRLLQGPSHLRRRSGGFAVPFHWNFSLYWNPRIPSLPPNTDQLLMWLLQALVANPTIDKYNSMERNIPVWNGHIRFLKKLCVQSPVISIWDRISFHYIGQGIETLRLKLPANVALKSVSMVSCSVNLAYLHFELDVTLSVA